MVTNDIVVVRNWSSPPRVSDAALRHRRRLADLALKKYETALRFTDDIVHSHLAENLRARLDCEEGTCQSFWMGKVKAQASEGCRLSDMASEAFDLVTECRSVEAAMSMTEYSQEARTTLTDWALKYGTETELVIEDEARPFRSTPLKRKNSLPAASSYELWLQNKRRSVPVIALDYEGQSLPKGSDVSPPRINNRSRDVLSLPASSHSRVTNDLQNKRLKRIHPPMLDGSARNSAENAYVAYHSQLFGSGSSKRARLEVTRPIR